jgi:hypothetical protein
MEARASLVLDREDPSAGSISFDLHETFRIGTVRLNGRPAEFTSTPNAPIRVQPASRRIRVVVPGENSGKSLTLEVDYGGKLKEIPEWGSRPDQEFGLDDRIGPERVELASYSCWYPFWRYGERFDVDLAVTLPADWTVTSGGDKTGERREGGRRITRWRAERDLDIVIIASPALKVETVRSDAGEVRLFYTRLPEEFIGREARESSSTLELFTKILGEPVSARNALRHVYSPREFGQGGFARPGLVVSSEGRVAAMLAERPDMSFLRGNAHEIAHFWWHFGTGQGDWINESLAEYFGLVAVEHLQGAERLSAYLSRYREAVTGLPADAPGLAQVPADNDGHHYTIRYTKGALFLHALRRLLGDERFFGKCREFHARFARQLIGTAEFREFWAGTDPAARELLQAWLDERGGIPDTATATERP